MNTLVVERTPLAAFSHDCVWWAVTKFCTFLCEVFTTHDLKTIRDMNTEAALKRGLKALSKYMFFLSLILCFVLCRAIQAVPNGDLKVRVSTEESIVPGATLQPSMIGTCNEEVIIAATNVFGACYYIGKLLCYFPMQNRSCECPETRNH